MHFFKSFQITNLSLPVQPDFTIGQTKMEQRIRSFPSLLLCFFRGCSIHRSTYYSTHRLKLFSHHEKGHHNRNKVRRRLGIEDAVNPEEYRRHKDHRQKKQYLSRQRDEHTFSCHPHAEGDDKERMSGFAFEITGR